MRLLGQCRRLMHAFCGAMSLGEDWGQVTTQRLVVTGMTRSGGGVGFSSGDSIQTTQWQAHCATIGYLSDSTGRVRCAKICDVGGIYGPTPSQMSAWHFASVYIHTALAMDQRPAQELDDGV